MKKYILLLSVIVISSCCKDVSDKPTPVNKNKDAILIYMASDNNLYSYAVKNISVMEGEYNEDAAKQILVYVDALNGDAKLIRLINTPKGEKSRSEVIKTYTKPNSSDPKVFEGVIGDAQAFIGSKRISDIMLWSHGKAWVPYNYFPSITSVRSELPSEDGVLSDGAMQYSFGVDNSTNKSEMNIDKLAVVLSKYKFDNIIFDACYMASIEVLYELRNSTSYIVSSPAEVLADGFAYSVTTNLLTESRLDGKKLAKVYFDFYDKQVGERRSATISVVDCAKLEPFAVAVKKVIDKYATKIDNDKMRTLVGQYDRYSSNEYLYDLKTYINSIIKSYAAVSDVDAELAALDASFGSLVIYEAHTPFMLNQLSFDGTYGISGYIPHNGSGKYVYSSYFKTLEWANASGLSNELFY